MLRLLNPKGQNFQAPDLPLWLYPMGHDAFAKKQISQKL
jgi:hypothetical protein